MSIGILAVVIVLAFAIITMYNGLIKKKNYVNEAFSGMDVALKKRHDLLPNLIETVKAYMKHEKDLLTEITALRSRAMNPNLPMNDKIAVENQLNKAISNIMVAVERYPDLKANQNFMQIQNTMNEVEFEIAGARKNYNSKVTDYNNAVEMFPTNIMANAMKLEKRLLFEIADVERKNVDVKNLFGNE